jgi:4-amino-4-deoxy-L-arabinose transferase-like glycosyltransferase
MDNMPASWPDRKRLLLVLILGYAAFLRLYRIQSVPPGLYRDEAMDGNNAIEVLETQRWQVFYPEDGGREGLYINTAALFVAGLGNEPWVLRLPAAIFGVVTVWGLYLLGAELFGVEAGLLAAFFLATSFWHVNFSRIAFRAIAAPCLLAWSLYLLLAGVRRARLWMVVLAGAVYGLGFYTYIAYRATPVLVALVLARCPRRVRWAFGAVAAAAVVPLAVYFARHPQDFWGRSLQVSVLQNAHPAREVLLNVWRTARMFFRHGDFLWRHNVAWRAELFWPVAVLFAIGVAVALWRRHKWAYTVPLVWMAVGFVPVVLSDDVMPHALRSILMAPAAMLLAAVGAGELLGRMGRFRAAALLLIPWLVWEPYHTYFDVWAKNPNVPPAFDSGAVEIARRIRAMPRDIEKVVVFRASDEMAAAPVMFLTRSYTARQRAEQHIRYVTAGDCTQPNVFCLEGVR